MNDTPEVCNYIEHGLRLHHHYEADGLMTNRKHCRDNCTPCNYGAPLYRAARATEPRDVAQILADVVAAIRSGYMTLADDITEELPKNWQRDYTCVQYLEPDQVLDKVVPAGCLLVVVRQTGFPIAYSGGCRVEPAGAIAYAILIPCRIDTEGR